MREVVLIHPLDGIYNRVYKPWLPLSILAVAAPLVHAGRPVRIIDTRVSRDWRRELSEALRKKPVCVGVTTMTGSQLVTAMDASRLVRNEAPDVPIVWGGPHPSLFPEPTIRSPLVDVLVMGEGEATFPELVERLEAGGPLEDIQGLCYKDNGAVRKTDARPFMDLDDLPELPYHLVDMEAHVHKYFSEDRVVEVETSRGCPFACKFCYNQLYSKRHFRAQSAERVVATLKKLNRDHGLRSFHFIDDAFFTDRKRGRRIMELVLEEGLDVRMGFQGIRVSHVAAMSDEELDLVYRAGARFFQFGVESGSPRILQLIEKRLDVEEVVEQNRRLARYPDLIPLYNFMGGFPTETREELFESTQLAWAILRDNPKAMVSPFHQYKHYPGTALYEIATKDYYEAPKELQEWASFDWTESIASKRPASLMRLLRRVETVSIFVDRKMEMQTDSRIIQWMTKLYRPVARFRLRRNLYAPMPEQGLMKAFKWYQKSNM